MPYLTSVEAETAFYQAFESADIDAMRAVLAMDDDCVCIHPGGDRIDGPRAILESWATLLSSGQHLRIAISGAVVQGTDRLAVHHVMENLSYGAGLRQQATVTATNVYRRSDNGWHMVAHCAAPGKIVPARGTVH